MRKAIQTLVLVVVAALVAHYYPAENTPRDDVQRPDARGPGQVEQAFAARASGHMLQASGRVIKILPDDNDGSRHQKFIMKLPSGHTVLVSHNIDVAPRVNGLREGDSLSLYGQYEWNTRGGVIHWTHHAPRGDHEGGWIEHNGRRYE